MEDKHGERFQKLMKFLDLELSKEQMKSARNYFLHGFDNSEQLNSFLSGQQVLKLEDPE